MAGDRSLQYLVALPLCERRATGTHGAFCAWSKSRKRVSSGGIEISRLVCGSDPFNGRSHFSEARDAEYASRFDDEAVVGRVLDRAFELGLDA